MPPFLARDGRLPCKKSLPVATNSALASSCPPPALLGSERTLQGRRAAFERGALTRATGASIHIETVFCKFDFWCMYATHLERPHAQQKPEG